MTSSGGVGARLNVPDRGPLPVHPDVARDGEVPHLNNNGYIMSCQLYLYLEKTFAKYRWQL